MGPVFEKCIYRHPDGYCDLREDLCPGVCTEFDGSEGESIPEPKEWIRRSPLLDVKGDESASPNS